MKLSIEVTSDFICPWCRIAEARLEGVLKTLPAEIEVDVKWLPFELNPNMPVEGMERVAYRSAKFGSWEYSRTLDAHTVEAGAEDGVIFNYEAMERVPNTLAAHRLVWFAPEGSIRNSLIERLFRAYFQEGKDIGDLSVLAEVAHEAGLDRSHVETFLKSKAGEAEVIQLEDRARQSRINSVPAFNIAGTRLSGAVASEVLYLHIMDAIKHQQMLGDKK